MMRFRKAAGAAAFIAVIAAGCDEKPTVKVPPPQEIGDTAIGHFCGMGLAEHPGPKGQIFVADRKEPYWFSSAREIFAFASLPEEPKAIVAIYVNDMGKVTDWDHPEPGTWIDARTAWYVIDSSRKGGMSDQETVPFGEATAATRFVAINGGRVVRFKEMPEAYIFPGASAAPNQQGG
jgi:copper chaperone NosL